MGQAVYSAAPQSKFMPAQYYKDPSQLREYFRTNKFLVDINNELISKNQRYKENMLKLDKFVMFYFVLEDVVAPAESSVCRRHHQHL